MFKFDIDFEINVVVFSKFQNGEFLLTFFFVIYVPLCELRGFENFVYNGDVIT